MDHITGTGAWWHMISDACWTAAFPDIRAQTCQMLGEIGCSSDGFMLLCEWWNVRHRRSLPRALLDSQSLMDARFAAIQARTLMLEVVHESRADEWATQHAPLRMVRLRPGEEIHRLILNLILRQAAGERDLRTRNFGGRQQVGFHSPDGLSTEEAWNTRSRWLPEMWRHEFIWAQDPADTHHDARPQQGPASIAAGSMAAADSAGSHIRDEGNPTQQWRDWAGEATSGRQGERRGNNGRARTRTPPRAAADNTGDGDAAGIGPLDPVWEEQERRRLFRAFERCWHRIHTNRTTGQPLTRDGYTWSDGVNCLVWTTCTPQGREELRAFLQERYMDERGMHVLTSWWQGLGIDTAVAAHDLLLTETSVRSYVGRTRGACRSTYLYQSIRRRTATSIAKSRSTSWS